MTQLGERLVEDRGADGTRLSIVDCDVHPHPHTSALLPYLERRWREHVESFGIRTRIATDWMPGVRTPSRRLDAIPPDGGPAGSDPAFAAHQLLDEYGIDIGILMCGPGATTHIGYNQPSDLSTALGRANNEWIADAWFAADPRWRASIIARVEEPRLAVAEIERCLDRSHQFVQIAMSPALERPPGDSKYWDIFEAATHYGLPISMHPGGHAGHVKGSGMASTFFEDHVGLYFGPISTVCSLIFEGVFDRWPSLKIVFTEAVWSWVIPLAWRLDASWRVLRSEVPHLQRKPSEYIGDHFWFTTQPMEAPEDPKWFNTVFEMFESLGLEGHMLFSSDYPHWDFDSPTLSIPRSLPEATRRAILADNAVALYGF